MAKTHLSGGWRKGVSFFSAGRLGAHAAGFEPAENGYLTYQSGGATFMLIGRQRQVIGSLQLPPRHRVEERTHSWTLRVARYRAAAQGGFPGLDVSVLASALSPAITFASRTDRLFRWRWQVRGSPQWMVFPTRGGTALAHYGRGLRARRPTGPPWTGNWLISFDPHGGGNVPVLWVFQRRPERVEVATYEYMDFHFARPFGRVMLMPLYGSAEMDRAELSALTGEGSAWRPDRPLGEDALRPRRAEGLPRLARWAEFWADVLTGLPDEVDEHFRLDRRAGTVEVVNTGRRMDGAPVRFCPVPPFLSAAGETRYPVRLARPPLTPPRRAGSLRPADLYTVYGPYRVVRGGRLRYAMPLCPYLDAVLSPVRVVGDARAERLTRRLRKYFDDPCYTYGGDGKYDPDRLQDILHNLRVLAWAAWSLPEDQRPAARQAIVRGFSRLFDRRSYRYFREPVTGRRIARERTVFDQFGVTTYDFDWYSGMNLAGLFAGVYFGAIPERLVRRRWALVRDIGAYFEVLQDWATFVPWTDLRGEVLNLDCCRHGMQGMIGLARLARRFGHDRQAELAEYVASRYMVFLAAETVLPDLYQRGGVVQGTWGRREGRMVLGFGGLHERDWPPVRVTSSARNPYTLSPLSPEHMLFLRDYGPVEKFRRYEQSVLDRDLPGWDTRPDKVYFAGRLAGNIELSRGAYHFYMVDPHLFLRMLVLDWPSRRAIGRVRELSGQVLAAALVADAPKVLCPAGLDFAGTTWDARQKVLTIRAQARSPVRATWQVLCPIAPRGIEGPRGARCRFTSGRLTLTAHCDGPVCWRLLYR